jgi:hypothetical protein
MKWMVSNIAQKLVLKAIVMQLLIASSYPVFQDYLGGHGPLYQFHLQLHQHQVHLQLQQHQVHLHLLQRLVHLNLAHCVKLPNVVKAKKNSDNEPLDLV